jgi:hypothetical protein
MAPGWQTAPAAAPGSAAGIPVFARRGFVEETDARGRAPRQTRGARFPFGGSRGDGKLCGLHRIKHQFF